MGLKNYLIEGVSCTGKTSVCKALRKRGYAAINGDNELAYQGDPKTGVPSEGAFYEGRDAHEHHIWDIKKLDRLLGNEQGVVFFCGGSRN